MATIKEIAAFAGVSRGTVDRVLNNRGGVSQKTADKIRRIMEEQNFQPNLAGMALATQAGVNALVSFSMLTIQTSSMRLKKELSISREHLPSMAWSPSSIASIMTKIPLSMPWINWKKLVSPDLSSAHTIPISF